MTIITISRDSFSKGSELAQKVADKLEYQCIARKVLLEASEEYNIPEIKLTRALRDSPSIFERLSFGKEKYISYIRHALLSSVKDNNIVYHGLAGQFFLKGVSHVLKVRIIADMEDRIKEEVKREHITEKEARQMLIKDDEERNKWSRYLFGIDTNDPKLYDISLHLGKVSIDEASEIIAFTSKRPCFEQTPESETAFGNLLLSAQVQSILIEHIPTVDAFCSEKGTIHISCKGAFNQENELKSNIRSMLKGVQGIEKTVFKITQ